MTEGTLVLPWQMAQEISDTARLDVETAGVLLAGIARSSGSLRLLAREMHWITDDAYARRTDNSMSITSDGYVPWLRRAEELSATPIFVHTHPGAAGIPLPSKWDDVVDAELAETFRIRSGSDVYASIVFSPAERLVRFSGRGVDGNEQFKFSRLVVSGDRLSVVSAHDSAQATLSPIFDRQVRAFGGEIQQVLASLTVGVVGCGGTGSAVAEQLVRLGVRTFVLVDPDTVSESNLTRVYGSNPESVSQPKAHVLAAHLRRIAPDSDVETYRRLVTDEQAARALTRCDVLFGCTDDNAGRLVLARLAAHYEMPLFDCGVLISSHSATIDAIDGRVTVQTPGAACLVCRGRVDLARAQAEQLDPAERQLRTDEGYAPELGRVEPSVVTYTSQVASQAVGELIERLVGYGPVPVPTEVLLRFHDREMSTNIRLPSPGHYCDPAASQLGRGDADPFLGVLWRSSEGSPE